MTFLSAIRLALASFVLAAGTACSETAAETPPAPQALNDADVAVAEIYAERPRPADRQPDFTRATVLKLNPIVERAKLALDRFDELGPQIAAAREAGDMPRIAAITQELAKLKADADAANTAFQAEKKALLGRDEQYNSVVLAAMEQFVAEAPLEIAEALRSTTR
ncbi:MAG TPA: hypothetical protein VK913_00140 [Erythrobacter sp.]|nr:hypothetical protein [Erythrobacter sp.]